MNTLIQSIQKYMLARFLSRWLILLKDIVIVALSVVLAYVIRFNFELPEIHWNEVIRNSFLFAFIGLFFFILFKSYIGIIRHTSITDTIKIFQAVTSAFFIIGLIAIVDQKYNVNFTSQSLRIPLSIVAISYLISLFALIFTRILIKNLYYTYVRKEFGTFNILIYGAGQSGIITKNTLRSNGSAIYRIVGFIDENSSLFNKSIEGVKVYSPAKITPEFVKAKKIDEIIFSIQNIDPQHKKEILDDLIKLGIVLKNVPPVDHWIQGKLSLKQIERVKIEDLLDRPAIKLDNPKIIENITGKSIMVTGAAGSIGSELVRQIVAYKPAKLILIDQAETPLFDFRLEMQQQFAHLNSIIHYYIADVSNQKRMSAIFEATKPTIVFHAAAYKHVPLMEENALEALRVNIFGTRIIADLSVKHQVETFVMISTDKAVKPTNVMGATKRLAEMYCHALGRENGKVTRFITTRFGNVLGSNGSVLKIFRKQIQDGGPVTVTDPEITRFFMTIPEACQLVIEASVMGENSEIFIFDMGKPVKIFDLATKMIKLAGLEPGKDVHIVFSGLRQGEKLYEELLNNSEDIVETYHPKIKIGKVKWVPISVISAYYKELQDALARNDDMMMVSILKKAIPDYISNNSDYGRLDKPVEGPQPANQ